MTHPPGDLPVSGNGSAGTTRELPPPTTDPELANQETKSLSRSAEAYHAAPPHPQFGEYELLEEVARGGMGVVYKARHVTLGRVVALKMILGGRFASPGSLARFQIEARAAAALNHPAIVPVYDIGEVDGQPFFTMAFVEGGSLQQKVAAGPLPPAAAARLLLQVAEAVQSAHDKGIIHRDLKPQNILLQPDDPATGGPGLRPMLTDFGLARAGGDSSGVTRTGEVMGTPSFMPPEQARGDTRSIGPCSDVYGLGAVLFCTLTGRPPFQGRDAQETIRLVLETEPPLLRSVNPAVPRDLEAICLRCLAKAPEARYASVAQFVEDLKCYLEDRPLAHARRSAALAHYWRGLKRGAYRRRLEIAVVGLIVVAGVGLGGWGVKSAWDGRKEFAARCQHAAAAVRQAEEAWQKGQRNEARDQFKSAQDRYADLLQRAPDRADLRLQLAALDIQKSRVLSQLHEMDAAEADLNLARDQLGLLPPADRGRPEARLALAEVYHNLAIVADARARRAQRLKAIEYYQESLQIRLGLWNADPANRTYRRDVARSYGFMGDTQLALGLKEAAWDSYQKAEEIRRRLAEDAQEADALTAKYQLGRSLGNTATYYDWLGDAATAIRHHRDRKAYLETLAGAGPPAEFATDYAGCLVQIAQLQLNGPPRPADDSQALLETALPTYQQLLAANPRDKFSIVAVAEIQWNLSKAAWRNGDRARAEELLENEVVAPLWKLVLDQRLDQPGEFYLMAQAKALKAQVAAGGPPERAKEALDYLAKAVEQGYGNLAALEREAAFAPFRAHKTYLDCVRRIREQRVGPDREQPRSATPAGRTLAARAGGMPCASPEP